MTFIKAKPALVILGTFIIGIIVGALALSVFMRYRMERLHSMTQRHGFKERMIETISPLSDTQREAVNREIETSSLQIDSTFNLGRKQVDAMIDTMVARLDSLLDSEQRTRLHHEVSNRFRMPPHPGGGPDGMPHHEPRFGEPPPDKPPMGEPPHGEPPGEHR